MTFAVYEMTLAPAQAALWLQHASPRHIETRSSSLVPRVQVTVAARTGLATSARRKQDTGHWVGSRDNVGAWRIARMRASKRLIQRPVSMRSASAVQVLRSCRMKRSR